MAITTSENGRTISLRGTVYTSSKMEKGLKVCCNRAKRMAKGSIFTSMGMSMMGSGKTIRSKDLGHMCMLFRRRSIMGNGSKVKNRGRARTTMLLGMYTKETGRNRKNPAKALSLLIMERYIQENGRRI